LGGVVLLGVVVVGVIVGRGGVICCLSGPPRHEGPTEEKTGQERVKRRAGNNVKSGGRLGTPPTAPVRCQGQVLERKGREKDEVTSYGGRRTTQSSAKYRGKNWKQDGSPGSCFAKALRRGTLIRGGHAKNVAGAASWGGLLVSNSGKSTEEKKRFETARRKADQKISQSTKTY